MDDSGILLSKALAGDSTAAADLWRLIAAGEASADDVLAWARDVARQVQAKILDADIEANRRPDAALKAIGLEGRIDKHRRVRDVLDVLEQFEDLEVPGRQLTRRQLVEIVKANGMLEDVPDANVKKVIDRIRGKG